MKQTLFGVMLLSAIASTAWAASDQLIVDVYKSPTCGCCSKWVDHLRANGFQVRAHNTQEVSAHKIRLGVPAGFGSCHTAQVGGYLIEGHVPANEIQRLLKEKPNARGLAVPAMPMGSPGMEAGGRKDVYDVFLVNRDGATQTYAHY